jgi:hypothetical protein
MALCAVVGTQLAQTLADRRTSRLVQVTSLGSAAALVALVQTPAASHLFGCTPLGPLAWAGVAVAIALALAGQRAVPYVENAVLKRWPSDDTSPSGSSDADVDGGAPVSVGQALRRVAHALSRVAAGVPAGHAGHA